MKDLLIVIPAIKKNASIPDQLVKKLNDKTLIQRAIDTAKQISNNILIITDSDEISLIAMRNEVKFYKDKLLNINSSNIIDITLSILKKLSIKDKYILIYRANTPLVDENVLKESFNEFLKNTNKVLVSVKKLKKNIFKFEDSLIKKDGKYFEELNAFLILENVQRDKYELIPYIIEDEKAIEIRNYQDWWLCEKLLQRKRIIFNVIGSNEIGMGHIYRALSIAHEIIDHEIIFICDEKYNLAVEKIASTDYKVISTNNVLAKILELSPNLVINDILNTTKNFIETLKLNNIKVINFEDLGEGAKLADLVINELYEEPIKELKNYKHILWGHKYVILRDEFLEAKRNIFKDKVENVLITFGGTDQHNLTLKVLKKLESFKNIRFKVVIGKGYKFKDELEKYISNLENIEIHYDSEIMSNIMENTQLAISSNGRTVYELAHMHIPSIIISHHERENTHTFARLENGFVNLGVYKKGIEEEMFKYFKKIVGDNEYRKLLFLNTLKFDFSKNKNIVLNKIKGLI